MAVLGFEPPLTPESDEARQLLLQELSKQKYQERDVNLIDKILNQLAEWFGALTEGNANIPDLIVLVVAILVIAGIIYALIRFGIPKLNRSSKVVASTLFGEEENRTAIQLQEAAEQAAAAQDWYQATILRFRAVARRMEERTIIDMAPSLTAQSFSKEISASFPGFEPQLAAVAASFDQVRYLLRPGTEHDYVQLKQLDLALEKSAPARLQPIAGEAR